MRWKSRTVMYKMNDVAVLFSIYRHCPNLGKLRGERGSKPANKYIKNSTLRLSLINFIYMMLYFSFLFYIYLIVMCIIYDYLQVWT